MEGHGEQEVASGPPSAAGGAALRRRQRKQEREEEDDRLDLFAKSEKFRGPTIKQK